MPHHKGVAQAGFKLKTFLPLAIQRFLQHEYHSLYNQVSPHRRPEHSQNVPLSLQITPQTYLYRPLAVSWAAILTKPGLKLPTGPA